jgi:hypothetical protein
LSIDDLRFPSLRERSIDQKPKPITPKISKQIIKFPISIFHLKEKRPGTETISTVGRKCERGKKAIAFSPKAGPEGLFFEFPN